MGRFAYLAETIGMKTHRFDNFVWNLLDSRRATP